jgi:hypothetical protein
MRLSSTRTTLALGAAALILYLVACLVAAGCNRWQELLAHERTLRSAEKHPPDLPGCLAAEAVVTASAASRCLVYRLGVSQSIALFLYRG